MQAIALAGASTNEVALVNRGYLGTALLFVASLSLSLVAAEFVLRLQNSSMKNYNIEMWRYANELKTRSAVPELGHEHLRDKVAILQSVEIRLNEWGLRGAPVAPLPTGGRRILFLGGSITLGWGVPEQDTVTARLEQKFTENGEQAQVLNAGVGNYNALRYVRNFLMNLKELEPTDIVVEYFLRDAEALDSGGGNILLRNSQLAVTVWAALHNVLGASGEAALRDHYKTVYDPAHPGFQAMKRELSKLAEYARERNIRLYFAMMPDVHNLTDYPFRAIHDQMRQAANELGFSYVDLLPEFENLKPAEVWAMPGDPHPNALGHRIMADQIYPVLQAGR